MSVLRYILLLGIGFLIYSPARSAEQIEIKAYEQSCWMLAYSPDGKTVVTLPNDGESAMKLWDAATGKLIWEVEKTGKNCASFSPEGKLIAIGAWAKVRLFESASGEWVRDIEPANSGSVCGAVFSPDGSKLAIVLGENNMVEVFDPATAKHLITLTAPIEKPAKGTGGISRVAFSPDGKTVVGAFGGKGWPDFVGKDSVIAVWDVKTWKLRASFTASTHNVNSLAISPDGELIAASCHRAKEVKIWKMPLPAEEKKVDPETIAGLVKQLDADAFGDREAAERKLREIGTPAREQLQKALDGDSAEAAFRARKILTGMKEADDGPLHLIKSNSDFQTVAFSPDGKLLATGSVSAHAKACSLWRLGPVLKRKDLPNARGAWALQFSPDGKQLGQGAPDGTVLLYEVEDLLPE